MSIYGDLIAYIDGKNVIVRNYEMGEEVQTLKHDENVNDMTWSPNGKYIASRLQVTFKMHVWDVHEGTIVKTLEDTHVTPLYWSPDGSKVASGFNLFMDSTVRVWDVSTWNIVHNLDLYFLKPIVYTAAISALCWSPDGKYIAVGGRRHVSVFDITGNFVHCFEGHFAREGEWVETIAWSPDGKYIASEADDETVHIWDMGTKKLARIIDDEIWGVNWMRWSPDGKYIAVGTLDLRARVWSLDGTLIAIWENVLIFQDGFVLSSRVKDSKSSPYTDLVKKIIPTFNKIDQLHKQLVAPEDIQQAFVERSRDIRKIVKEIPKKLEAVNSTAGEFLKRNDIDKKILELLGLDEGDDSPGASKEPESKGEYLRLRF